MSSIQLPTATLPHVTKLHRHRSVRTHKRRHLSKIKDKPSIVVHTRIHSLSKVCPKDENKISSVASNDHSFQTTAPIQCQQSEKKSSATPGSFSVTKVRRSHYSSTETDANKSRNDEWIDDDNNELKIARENTNSSTKHTPELLITKSTLSKNDCHQPSPMESDASVLNVHNNSAVSRSFFRKQSSIQRSRMGFTADIYDTIHRNKQKRSRKCPDTYYYSCSPLCAFLCLLGGLLVCTALSAVLVGILIKSNTTISTSVTSTVLTTLLVGISNSTNTTISTSVTSTLKPSVFNVNMVTNGNAETGSCEMNSNITSPTGWNYNGTVTQIYYNSTATSGQSLTTPGPSDRGQCFFYGQISVSTTMWQTINLTNYVDSALIDNQTVKYNLSAWLGGISNQDDSGTISLTFTNQTNQIIGSGNSIGPVLASDRGNISSLIFRQTNGFVPIGARFLTLLVTFIRFSGNYCNGAADDIAVFLYQ